MSNGSDGDPELLFALLHGPSVPNTCTDHFLYARRYASCPEVAVRNEHISVGHACARESQNALCCSCSTAVPATCVAFLMTCVLHCSRPVSPAAMSTPASETPSCATWEPLVAKITVGQVGIITSHLTPTMLHCRRESVDRTGNLSRDVSSIYHTCYQGDVNQLCYVDSESLQHFMPIASSRFDT